MKEAIRQKARELGFDDCRFTSAAPPDSAPRLQEWLAQSKHGQMLYLERNAAKRADPRLVLPGAASLITLAVSYGAGVSMSAGRPLAPAGPSSVIRGQIARYARFQDYHDVLAEPLKALSAFVNSLGGGGARSLWYVDTGPILERDLAQRAGLGFVGKHTNLISRSLGNWFFLAEILTTVALEPDAPETNHCGSCFRCQAACPTGAITAPFQLDARLCLSYLTIEIKGSIPIEWRTAIGNRIYGCDDCLAACPWNRFAREANLMKSHARPELSMPDLMALLALDEEGFRRQFAGTPMLRAKRRGLLRNVCVALGNLAGPEAMPSLARAAADPESLIVEHALWAIDQIARRSRV